MGRFPGRMAILGVMASSPMAVVALVMPAVSSADCGGRTWDPVARVCVPPPPVPDWYQPAPTYAQPWAPPWAPPPPPPPPPVVCPAPYNTNPCGVPVKAVWDPRYNEWTWVPSGQ